jgi:hypothetical protein
MSFTRANVAGWANGERLTSTQMNQLDLDHSYAIDGNAGGTYTPSAAIIINGSGIEFAGYSGANIVAAIPGRSSSYKLEVSLAQAGAIPADWSWSGSNGFWTHDATTANILSFSVRLPPLGKLSEVRAVVSGAAGHAALPAVMPQLQIRRAICTIGSAAIADNSLGTQLDTSASFAAYELNHEIAITGLNHTIVTTDSYYIRFTGETGANSVSGLQLGKIYCVLTV